MEVSYGRKKTNHPSGLVFHMLTGKKAPDFMVKIFGKCYGKMLWCPLQVFP